MPVQASPIQSGGVNSNWISAPPSSAEGPHCGRPSDVAANASPRPSVRSWVPLATGTSLCSVTSMAPGMPTTTLASSTAIDAVPGGGRTVTSTLVLRIGGVHGLIRLSVMVTTVDAATGGATNDACSGSAVAIVTHGPAAWDQRVAVIVPVLALPVSVTSSPLRTVSGAACNTGAGASHGGVGVGVAVGVSSADDGRGVGDGTTPSAARGPLTMTNAQTSSPSRKGIRFVLARGGAVGMPPHPHGAHIRNPPLNAYSPPRHGCDGKSQQHLRWPVKACLSWRGCRFAQPHQRTGHVTREHTAGAGDLLHARSSHMVARIPLAYWYPCSLVPPHFAHRAPRIA